MKTFSYYLFFYVKMLFCASVWVCVHTGFPWGLSVLSSDPYEKSHFNREEGRNIRRVRYERKRDRKTTSRCQFHQRFYLQIFRTNVVLAAFSRYVLALNKLSNKKCARIMLMKLTEGDTPKPCARSCLRSKKRKHGRASSCANRSQSLTMEILI